MKRSRPPPSETDSIQGAGHDIELQGESQDRERGRIIYERDPCSLKIVRKEDQELPKNRVRRKNHKAFGRPSSKDHSRETKKVKEKKKGAL